MKKIKMFNIGGIHLSNKLNGFHVYIGAHSRADASRVVNEYLGNDNNHTRYLATYGAECWGTSMKGIEPERGMWIQDERFKADNTIKRVV